MSKALLLAFLTVLALARVSGSLSETITKHIVTGVVTDADGSEVANAYITAMATDGSSGGDLSWVHTDTHGRFRIALKPGRYLIRAKDEASGYPDPNFLLSADPIASFPEIVVDQADILGVRVRLGSKGGVLEGDVRDQETQSPVTQAKVTIRDARKPDVFVEVFSDKTGHFQFTVPKKPIQILATAPGYTTTYFGTGEALTLSGGERRSVVIELKHE